MHTISVEYVIIQAHFHRHERDVSYNMGCLMSKGQPYKLGPVAAHMNINF